MGQSLVGRVLTRRKPRRLPPGGGAEWTPPPIVTADGPERIDGFAAASYDETRVPAAFERHLAQRFSGGWTIDLGEEIERAGGARRWFLAQLSGGPDSFYESSKAWWPALGLAPLEIWERDQNGTEPMWVATGNYQRWALVRRIHSERQVLEAMADFWENVLHVPTAGESEAIFRLQYGQGIRAKALGKFSDLLKFAITHPSMGCYLNLATSRKSAPNEDLARELLEVHTVGAGNFTEDDVVNSARILTGYRVNAWWDWKVSYDQSWHWTGPVRVLNFSHANASPDGRPVTAAYLDHLARHPLTARRLARRLAVRFVSDQPSAALVERLASVYLANDTSIVPVLIALVDSAEFAEAAGAKVRLPEEDVVATYRALGVQVAKPADDDGGEDAAATAIIWQAHTVGLAPFMWPRPDGRPDTGRIWSSTSRVLQSFDLHLSMSGAWWPKRNATYRRPIDWLPVPELRFDQLVDHLSRSMLGLRSTDRLLKAACEATESTPDEIINAKHDIVTWRMFQLLQVLLDHPDHMTR